MSAQCGRRRTHRAALLVTLSGEIRTEEQVGDGEKQRLSKRPRLVLAVVFIQALEGEETS